MSRTFNQSLASVIAASRAWSAQHENREDYERNESDIIAIKHHLANPPDTLRDELAGRAMQGVLSSNALLNGSAERTPEMVAEFSYLYADKMLEARKS